MCSCVFRRNGGACYISGQHVLFFYFFSCLADSLFLQRLLSPHGKPWLKHISNLLRPGSQCRKPHVERRIHCLLLSNILRNLLAALSVCHAGRNRHRRVYRRVRRLLPQKPCRHSRRLRVFRVQQNFGRRLLCNVRCGACRHPSAKRTRPLENRFLCHLAKGRIACACLRKFPRNSPQCACCRVRRLCLLHLVQRVHPVLARLLVFCALCRNLRNIAARSVQKSCGKAGTGQLFLQLHLLLCHPPVCRKVCAFVLAQILPDALHLFSDCPALFVLFQQILHCVFRSGVSHHLHRLPPGTQRGGGFLRLPHLF